MGCIWGEFALEMANSLAGQAPSARWRLAVCDAVPVVTDSEGSVTRASATGSCDVPRSGLSRQPSATYSSSKLQ
ncbi:hypothetical protein GCM10010319_49690 [Streptomyces blastmyceticus]|uniref:Uncharacterized protein n=1 Tax=Streptomyces blastmyceticus TaxID=68180 RepID=A0ABN0XJM0_9ACTN